MDKAISRVSIIILNWNGLSDTVECLNSVKTLNYPNYETIVVDNGSTDGSPEKIEAMFPDATILRNKKNLGYAGGNNAGIRHALKNGADYVWILNNDVVVEKESLTKLIDYGEKHARTGILGPTILSYNAKDRIDLRGVRMVWNKIETENKIPFCPFLWLENGKDIRAPENAITDVDSILGCSFLVKKEVFEKIGLFTEKFFLLHEETDFCLRAKKAGFGVAIVPQAVIWHKLGTSFSKAGWNTHTYYDVRNELLLITRHAPFRLKFKAYAKASVLALCEYKKARWIRNPELLGTLDFFIHRFGKCAHKF